MKHISEETWQLYINDELPDDERNCCEEHMTACDSCLELYMSCLDRAAERLPQPDMHTLTERTMLRWDEHMQQQGESSAGRQTNRRLSRSWMRHPIFHYAVAAAITLILMGSGVFQMFAQQVNALDPRAQAETDPVQHRSFSNQLMNKTIGMLDAIQPKQEERGKLDE